ncbi:MAG: arylsulfatase [Gemmataceae bacterium]
MRRSFVLLVTLLSVLSVTFPLQAAESSKPNIIFILADDLGYGDLGCYGQKLIQTPNIDRLATEGMRFTDAYAGSTVCAPSRCVLMTGKHTGHARVRGNARVPLEPEDVTVAEVLKAAGYTTGLIGKWGLGEPDSTGVPNKQGFDYFFGYLNQHHAHNYYPDYLWRNQTKVPLPGNVIGDTPNVAEKRTTYSHDLFTAEALKFVRKHHKEPFFLYLAYTIPHANNERTRATGSGNEVPSDEPYTDKPWKQQNKDFAAMITRMDRDIGTLMDTIQELGLDENTLVIFTSDNGPHREGGNDPQFFQSSGPLRGIKRDLTEGGIRMPFIARWTNHIPAGTVSDLPCDFADFLPTAAALAGVKPPAGSDGVSLVPTLLGPDQAGQAQARREYLYWEFHERGFQQAIRLGPWKALRLKLNGPIELYDLSQDIGETTNVAERHPDIVAKAEKIFQTARTDSPHWPIKPAKQK